MERIAILVIQTPIPYTPPALVTLAHIKKRRYMSQSIAVVGAGICGLFTGLSLARKGFDVTLFERDVPPPGGSAEDAFFSWQRRGAAHRPVLSAGRTADQRAGGRPNGRAGGRTDP